MYSNVFHGYFNINFFWSFSTIDTYKYKGHFSFSILNNFYILGVGERQDKILWGFFVSFWDFFTTTSKATPMKTLELKNISSYLFIYKTEKTFRAHFNAQILS